MTLCVSIFPFDSTITVIDFQNLYFYLLYNISHVQSCISVAQQLGCCPNETCSIPLLCGIVSHLIWLFPSHFTVLSFDKHFYRARLIAHATENIFNLAKKQNNEKCAGEITKQVWWSAVSCKVNEAAFISPLYIPPLPCKVLIYS